MQHTSLYFRFLQIRSHHYQNVAITIDISIYAITYKQAELTASLLRGDEGGK